MKIAYLSTFYPFRGGIAQFNAALFREFEKMGNEIKAFTFKRQYPSFLFPGTSQMVSENDKVDKIPSQRIIDTINPLSYLSAGKIIKRYNPEMMIMKFWMPFFAPSLGWVAKKQKSNGTKNIAILDNVIPHERRIGDIALTKFFLNQNDGFIVMSENVKNDLLLLKPDAKFKFNTHPLYNHFGEKMNKVQAKKSLGLNENQKLLLFFGFIRSYKGLDLLLEAMKDLREDYVLLIAGESYGDYSKYDELISKNKIENRVIQKVRYIEDSEVPLFFSAADACVLPYKSATQSGIVGISYHFNLPVIATDVGGLKEMIVPYNTGLMVKDANSQCLKEAIIQYFSENKITEYEKNIEDFKKIASWSSLANSIIELYESVK